MRAPLSQKDPTQNLFHAGYSSVKLLKTVYQIISIGSILTEHNIILLIETDLSVCTTNPGGDLGYGKSANEAKCRANLGMQHAKEKSGNFAYIVYDGKKIIGQLTNISQNPEESGPIIDEKFLRISEKVGVSINTVFKLHCIAKKHGKNDFTIKELAPLFGVTTRNMNWIIEKFETHGFTKIIGKESLEVPDGPAELFIYILGEFLTESRPPTTFGS